MSAQAKYTDRDVRENPEFYALAHNYVTAYEGEFQFLIDCKMRVAQEIELSPGMVRGILNCMRVDPRVPDMPQPLPAFEADVIPMRESRRPNRRTPRRECILTEPHTHSYSDWEGLMFCPGIYQFNRPYQYDWQVNIKPGYTWVKGKSPATTRIHFATSAAMRYYPNSHTHGWARKPELIVRTNCKYPYYLRDPFLLNEKLFVEAVNSDNEMFECDNCSERGIVFPRI